MRGGCSCVWDNSLWQSGHSQINLIFSLSVQGMDLSIVEYALVSLCGDAAASLVDDHLLNRYLKGVDEWLPFQ